MPNVFGYCRISKGREDHVHSLDAQAHAIKHAYEFKKAEWGEPKLILPPFMDEKVSGRNINFLKRPAAQLLVGRLRAGDRVVVAKVDRAFRNTQDMFITMDVLDRMKVAVYFCDLGGLDTSTPLGKMFLTLTTALAQFEADRLRERTKDAIAVRKALNMHPTMKAPIGWKWVFCGQGRPRKPRVEEIERKAALKVMELHGQGLSAKEIATVARRQSWNKPPRIRLTRWNECYVGRLIKANLLNYPITDEEAEGKLDLPTFKLEADDVPVRAGDFFDEDQYPIVEGLEEDQLEGE